VVAVGGDGTANEVANGFFVADAGSDALVNPAARFGLIPTGTGADLARGLGLRGRPLAIARAILAPGARTRAIDVARARFVDRAGSPGRRYFLNGADLGLGGETAALANAQGPGLKSLGGVVTYLVAAVRAILAHRPATVRYVVDDGAPRDVTLDLIFLANGPFTAGGMVVAPNAALDDGLLDVILLRQVGKLEILLRLLPAIYRGAHLGHPAVEHVRARQLRVETSANLLLELDGEQPGRAPADFAVLPRTLTVLVGEALAAPSRP
jgi:YegS/Rv2252/BmrU family lipid kinase